MPHPDNNNWMSLLVGQPLDAAPPTSVDQIPAIRALMDFPNLNVDLPDLAAVHERVVLRERDGVELAAEIYVPKGTGPFPVLQYMHGGGWCVGATTGVRRKAMRLSENGFVVVNLDYGLAPEHPFPWGVEDCVYASRWILRNIGRYDGDGARLFIGGDSAGANLSAATIVALTGQAEVDGGDLAGVEVGFSGALLFYGVFDFPLLLHEAGSNAGYVEIWFNMAYLGPRFLRHHLNPLVSPIHAPDLSRFPSTYLSVGDEDSLLSQSLAMTKSLTQANVPTTLSVIAGFDHTFSYVEHLLPGVTPEMERIFVWMRSRASA